MNTLGNHTQRSDAYDHKGVRLTLGGCLLLALVCGFLYFAALQAQQMPKPAQSKIAQQKAKKPTIAMPEQQSPSALAMKVVSLPAPPPVKTTAKHEPYEMPKPVTKPVTKAEASPATKPLTKPASKPKTKRASQTTKVVDVSQHQSKSSEHLLQQVEAGKGPSIEINWPAQSNQRQALFSTLVDCLGVGLGVLVNGSVTPIHDSGRQYSRLVRMVGGKMVEREARFHRQSGINGVAVRLFPRHVDSRLLAGLAHIAPKPLSKYAQVQGVYVLAGGSLWVKNIYFDGTLSQGQVLLARGACRR